MSFDKKICFMTEMQFTGKIPRNHSNMRVEFSWMCLLNADHIPLNRYNEVRGYDYVVCILPKGNFTVDMEGTKAISSKNKPLLSSILNSDILGVLKGHNGKLCFMQEGPSNMFNDYELFDQILHTNFITECDIILAHNEVDVLFYSGLSDNQNIYTMPSVIIEDNVKFEPSKRSKTMIGGNFSRWYGGFQSYYMALGFNTPIFVPSSHSKRPGEEDMDNLNILPWMDWTQWMKTLSEFSYAIHLMPTVAAGTFSLNCAFYGIPCIGNINLDTQRICHPTLSVDVNDLASVKYLVHLLKTDEKFYNNCSLECSELYFEKYDESNFISHMKGIFV